MLGNLTGDEREIFQTRAVLRSAKSEKTTHLNRGRGEITEDLKVLEGDLGDLGVADGSFRLVRFSCPSKPSTVESVAQGHSAKQPENLFTLVTPPTEQGTADPGYELQVRASVNVSIYLLVSEYLAAIDLASSSGFSSSLHAIRVDPP